MSLSNPADYTKIKDNLVNEIQVQLKQKVSGKGWYDADILKTFNTLSRMPGFEKLGNNENHRVILSAILGATSPGPKVSQNVRAGLAQYLKWSRTGKFSTKSPPPGTSIEGIEKPGLGPFGFPQGLRMIEFLINKFGVQEYIVNRAKRDKQALYRNAKLRLSNIHPSRLLMNLRGENKWIK